MNVLAVDCSTEILSVGVYKNIDATNSKADRPKHPYKDALKPKLAQKNSSAFAEISIDSGYKHVERIIKVIEQCLSELELEASDLDLLSCAKGPGSFTGLRIALSTIKGLSMGLNKPFVLVPTLEAIARTWYGTSRFIMPIIDAKRSHFYFALYDNAKLIAGPFDAGLEKVLEIASAYQEVLFVGPDADMLEESIAELSGLHLAKEHNKSCVRAMAEAAIEIFNANGREKTDTGLYYIRVSDAEEAKFGQNAI